MKILLAILFSALSLIPSSTFSQNKGADEDTLRKKAIYSVLIFYNIGKMTPQDVNPGKNSATFLLLDQFVLENTEYNQVKVNFIRNGDSVWKYELQQNGNKITFFMPKLQLPSPEQLVPQGLTFEVSMPERKQPFIMSSQDLAPEHAKLSGQNFYRPDDDKGKEKPKEKDKDFLKSLSQWDDGFSEKDKAKPENDSEEPQQQTQDEFPLRLKALHPQPLNVGAQQIFFNVLFLRPQQGPELTEITVNTFVNGVPGKPFQFPIPPLGQTQGGRIPMDTSKINSPGSVILKLEFICRSADGKEFRREFSKTVNANPADGDGQNTKRGFKRSL